MSQSILVVDDKELVRDSVATMLARTGWNVRAAADGPSALRIVAEDRPDVVLTDLSMPDMDGMALLERLRRVDEHMPVVLMTAFATVQTAVEAMKKGAFDYLTKPFDGDELVLTIRRAVKHAKLARENEVLKTQLGRLTQDRESPRMVGETAAMRLVRSQIEQIAQSQGTVLIMGESGVGKEVVAQMTHSLSQRAKAPFLAINCAALSTSLLESELFGHERGAFTGAERLRKGRFELAHGGTLLLDEISEIPPGIQAKLLRVLQERAFERVGSSVTQTTDVRVLATTNRDLRRSVAEGRFRQDLFYRLNVLPIVVPPLRDRVDDIPLLCEHLLRQVAQREGRPPKRFDDEAIAVLQSYPWPGNVRELFNICERACIFTGNEAVIRADVIHPWLAPQAAGASTAASGAAAASGGVGLPEPRIVHGRHALLQRNGPGVGQPGAREAAHEGQPSVAPMPVPEVHSPAIHAQAGGDDLHLPVDDDRPELEVEVTSTFRRQVAGMDPQTGATSQVVTLPGYTASPRGEGGSYVMIGGSDFAAGSGGLQASVATAGAVVAHDGTPGSAAAVARTGAADSAAATADPAVVIVPPGRALEDIERDVIVAALHRHNGHRQNTARELKIGVRTLGLKLRKWKDEHLVAADL